jgi:hypothetical protein
MIRLDLLLNLILVPIGFLLLVMFREWLHRTLFASTLQRVPLTARRVRVRTAIALARDDSS